MKNINGVIRVFLKTIGVALSEASTMVIFVDDDFGGTPRQKHLLHISIT